MPERASITQAVQIGVEATPGTNVAANKLLSSIGISLGLQADMQTFRPAGQKFKSVVTPGKEWSGLSISGRASYSEIAYLLSCLVNDPTPAQQGATTAYKRTYSPAARSEDSIKTLTIEQGGAVRAAKVNYGLLTELSLEFTRDAVNVSGSGIAQRLQDGITMTATPTGIVEVPVLPTQIDVYLDATSAALGTTKLLRVLRAGWRFGSRFNPLWTLNSANQSYAAHVEAEPAATSSLLVEADALGMGPLTNLRAGSTAFLRIACISPVLAGTAFPYSMTIDMAVKINGVNDFSDEDGVYAIEWPYEIVYDATWGKAFNIDVVNALATL